MFPFLQKRRFLPFHLDKSFYTTTHRTQSEFLRLDLFDRDEERFGHIVVCFGGGGVLYTAQEKHIERVHFEAAERINIR